MNHRTAVSVLAEAGGFTDKTGNKPHVQIADPEKGASRVISMNGLLSPAKALEVILRPGQIIYVLQTAFARVSYVLKGLSPLIEALSFGIVAEGL